MKIKFLATNNYFKNTISNEIVNGMDLSEVPNGMSIYQLPKTLTEVGILGVSRSEAGELFVTLQQACVSYEYPVASHDWKESGWIPAEEFDPNECYIIPASVEDKTDYEMVFRDTVETLPSGVEVARKGWTAKQTGEAL